MVTRGLFVVFAVGMLSGCIPEDDPLPISPPSGRFDDPSDLRSLGVHYLELAKAEVFTPSVDFRQQEVLGVLATDPSPWVRAATKLEKSLEPGLVLTIDGATPSRAAPDLSDGGVTLELVGSKSFCRVRVLLPESADLRITVFVEQLGCQLL